MQDQSNKEKVLTPVDNVNVFLMECDGEWVEHVRIPLLVEENIDIT